MPKREGTAMNRREFVASAAVLGSATLGGMRAYADDTRSAPAVDGGEHARPNILIIFADEHRADSLGCYGNPDLRSPHIDALARDGVRYTSAFCTYPVCTPSRFSLLSGQYVHEHTCSSNHCTLPASVPTFPRLLRDAGYRTAAVGKMHFTPTYLDVGFEAMILAEQDGPGRWDDDYHRELREQGLVDVNDLEDQRKEYRDQARPEYWETLGAMPSNLPARYHSSEWIAGKAMGFLEDWGAEANLLMVGFIKPHHPFDPPAEWADAYDPQKVSIPPGWSDAPREEDLQLNKGYFRHDELKEAAVRRAVAYYYATIEHMDAQIGQMIDALKRKGLYDNTLIVYTSDHGEYMGSHHLLLKGGYLYDPVVRVPLVIKYPRGWSAGTTVEGLVSLIDVTTTVVANAGCTAPPPMRGLDLRSATEGRDVVFAESRGGNQRMVRTRHRKLVTADAPAVSMLYDLDRDPLEVTNMMDDPAYRDDRMRLETLLAEWRDPSPLPQAPVDENAPVINQPNVPPRTEAYRQEMIDYFAMKMKRADEL